MEGPKQNHGSSSSSSSEAKRLELRLGPPCEHDWATTEDTNHPLNYLSNKYYYHSLPVRGSVLSQSCNVRTVDKKAYSPSPANNAPVPNSSQKRSAPASVVGWPPIRSFRKNLATPSSSKSIPGSENEAPNKVLSENPAENSTQKGFLVKINMDGVPIGRKVDLKVHDSYEKLSSVVDGLFSGLLAAQRDSQETRDREIIKGLVNGISGEYTLVYEDNEGDRMLVGDVPWHMFVSTVKRLRVLKTSELSKLIFGTKQDKISLVSARK